MIKKLFLMVAVAVVFAACGGNQAAKPADEKKEECAAVCVGKVIANPAEFAGKEMAFAAHLAKCDSTGNFYACADSIHAIQIVPAAGVTIAQEMVGKAVKLTGKVVDGKIEVSAVEAAPACCSGDKVGDAKGGCCGEKKECGGEKAATSCDSKKEGGCCSEKKAEAKS